MSVKIKAPEHQEALALIEWASFQKWYPWFLHIPNERSNKSEREKLAWVGVRPGVPDYFLAVPNGKHHGLFIELKSMRGKLTERQKSWLDRLTNQGYMAVVAFGWWQAKSIIEEYLA